MHIQIRAFAAVWALSLAAPAFAQDAPAQTGPAPVIRDTDGALTCAQMSEEAARLSAQMGGRGGDGVFGQLGGVAKAGAAMLIPGAGLLIAGAILGVAYDLGIASVVAAVLIANALALVGLIAVLRSLTYVLHQE
jgi:hypothetical protein